MEDEKPREPEQPDPLTSAIVYLHQIFIICLTIVLTFYALHIIWFITGVIGTIDLNPLTNMPIFSCSFYYFCWVIVKICEVIICILLVLLIWIFVFWLIILILVPIIIIFPIPIIPFIFIIPLRPLLLLLIPPFKVLTDLGTLPLMLRICKRIINPQIFTNTLNYLFYPTMKDVGGYFKYHITNTITNVIGDDIKFLYEKPIDINIDDNERNNDMEDFETDEDKEDMKKYNEYKENDNVKSTMEMIERDTDMCISLNQNFKPYNSDYLSDIMTDMDNSFSPYSKCYTNAIKSYLKTSITQ
jgi:hypothetical protein